jgi:predicted Rossmann fold flavoprotein
MNIAVIGGGAAGFMAAITAQEASPSANVHILEKSNQLLAKVKVSGGGRCNLTHACFSIAELCKHYPRGGKQLKKSFGHFYTQDTIQWYEERGVALKTEADGRMFPEANSSQAVIDCLLGEAKRLGVRVSLKSAVDSILPQEEGFLLLVNGEELPFDQVIVASGGTAKESGLAFLKALNHSFEKPVPSLFTFNMPQENIKSLMGVVAAQATVRLEGTKIKESGALLITHWGMSGPAILKTSAFGARILADKNYHCQVQINWASLSEQVYQEGLSSLANLKKNPFQLPQRLWEFLLEKVELDPQSSWSTIGKKQKNRLLNCLMNDSYQLNGKTTFKEEFVTCGGVSLSEVNMSTMESRLHPGLFFAGEVLDIDGVTGGFNFQAAWTTGFLAGKNSVG